MYKYPGRNITALVAALVLAGCSSSHNPFKKIADIQARDTQPTYQHLPQDNPADGFTVAPLSDGEQLAIQQVLDNTNKLRREKGLPPLQPDPGLNAFAKVRAHELIRKFSHTRPDGSDISSGIDGSYIGENIAAGSTNAKDTVMNQWRNSRGHYLNMINPNYTTIGIGIAYAPESRYGYYWVQVFSRDNVKSVYHFAGDERDDNDTPPETLLDVSGTSVNSHASIAYRRQELTHPIYAETLRRDYDDGGYMLIQNPGEVFTYQTFAEIYNAQGIPVDYLNIGTPVLPAENNELHATYRGASVGNYGQHSHVYADVTARVDYGKQQKSMRITFANSQMADADISTGNIYQPLSDAPQFNFSDTLHWNDGRFTAQGIHAAFYGSSAQEIGGQFRRQIGKSLYRGAFGAVRN